MTKVPDIDTFVMLILKTGKRYRGTVKNVSNDKDGEFYSITLKNGRSFLLFLIYTAKHLGILNIVLDLTCKHFSLNFRVIKLNEFSFIPLDGKKCHFANKKLKKKLEEF